jgi:hypothetical protein
MKTIYRGNSAEINFSVNDSDHNPISLATMTDIRACIQTTVLDIAGTGTQVVDAALGKFKVVLTTVESAALDEGRDKIVGQIEFGTAVDPIEFTASVLIKDKPC